MKNKGKIRNFKTIIGLYIVTLGLYLFYWPYIIKEELKPFIENSLTKQLLRKVDRLYFAYLLSSLIVIMIVAYCIRYSIDINSSFMVIVVLIICALTKITFFFNFTKVVYFCQLNRELEPFNVHLIFIYYVIGQTIPYVHLFNILPTGIGFVGFIFILIYIYKIQQQINRVWI